MKRAFDIPIAQDRAPIVVDEKLSLRPYTMRVPNRTALGTSFFTQKADCHLVSLSLLSIQEQRA